MESVALLFRQGRLNKGWTQEEAARMLGCCRASVGHVERGFQRPGADLLRRAAKVYGYNMADMMSSMAAEEHREQDKEEQELLKAVRNKDVRRAMTLVERLIYGDQ